MIFGREPAAVVGAVQAVVALLVTIGLIGWNPEQVALLMAGLAAVLGVIVAAVTRDTMLGFIITLVNAIAAIVVGFGFALNPEVTSGVVAAITLAFGLFQRTQTSPTRDASFAEPRTV